jgi:hypothetical protein
MDIEPLEFTSVPVYGTTSHLKGIVRHDDAANLKIAVYIRVYGGWWTKPYWDSPAIPIAEDGTFSVNITTGGHDEHATEIVAFVIPAQYYPPGLRGEAELPAELIQKSVARAQVARAPIVPNEP